MASWVGLTGCAGSPTSGPTGSVSGYVTAGEDDPRVSPAARLEVRLERGGGDAIDRLVLDPVGTMPALFELVYDQKDAGGDARVVAELSVDGRIRSVTLDPPTVVLDGRVRAVVCELAPPRRTVGP